MRIGTFLMLLVSFTLMSGPVSAKRRHMNWRPLAKAPYAAWSGEIELKIRDGHTITLDGGIVRDRKGLALIDLPKIMGTLPLTKVRQAFGLSVPLVQRMVKTARSHCRCDVGDLSLYVTFATRASENERLALLTALNAHPAVEVAYPKNRRPTPPVDIAPTTPDYTGDQDYFGDAPSGIQLSAARALPGGSGEGIRFVDIEINFHPGHEDLEACQDALIPGVTGLYDDPEYTAHGTAVLGILFGGDNGYGVTGSIHRASCHFSPDFSDSWGYDVARAITNAMASVDAPAVLLLEAQDSGPNYDPNTGVGLVPSEWLPSVYDAIALAVASGYVVVEAAGNGYENLDDPIYEGAFDPETHDSGAIMVGAGTPPAADGTGRIREYYSNYGARVDVHGWGSYVTTTGYGDLFTGGDDENQYYTSYFAGTSSASPIVASAVSLLLSVLRARGYDHACTTADDCDPGMVCDTENYATARCIGDITLSSQAVRQLLRQTGSPQLGDTSERIGPLPNLAAAIEGLAICGDGVVEGIEMCDDGNTTSGDGCSGNCASDETCGNGVVDVDEVCDDGNTTSGDGCSDDCASDETCGNGIVDMGEACDDGNTTSGDGCSDDCTSDESCGNGMVDVGEVCDDGNTTSGDGCAADCLSDESCGNGIVDINEACDDGNTIDDDECPNTCLLPDDESTGCSCTAAGSSSPHTTLPLLLMLGLGLLLVRRGSVKRRAR